MYRLTIHHADDTTTGSRHSNAADAKHALAQYVDHANCQTHAIQIHSKHSSWDLITLDDNRVHATAVIEYDTTAQFAGARVPPTTAHASHGPNPIQRAS